MAKSAKHGSGSGGLNTRQHVKVGIKSGPPHTKIVSVSAAGSIGRSKGDHVASGGGKTVQRQPDPLIQGTRPQVPSGNAVALNAAGSKAGPCAGRILHGPSGTQGQHGPVNPGLSVPLTPGGGPGGFGFSG